jgi:hypothetical protein
MSRILNWRAKRAFSRWSMLIFDADALFRDVSRRKKVSSKAGQFNEYLDETDKSCLFRRKINLSPSLI